MKFLMGPSNPEQAQIPLCKWICICQSTFCVIHNSKP